MARYMETIRVAIPEGCQGECCEIPVDCPDCPSIPTTYIFTIASTGDLAFLNGVTVTIDYAGYSGGFFNWLGTTTVDGCSVQIGWGMEDNSTCSFVAGDIVVDCPDCEGPQSFDGGTIAGAFSFSCSPPTFSCNTSSQLLNYSGAQCFTGTIGGTAVAA